MSVLIGEAKEDRLLKVVLELAGDILTRVGLVSDFNQGYELVKKTFENGRAAEIFEKMVFSLGGNINFLSNVDAHVSVAPIVEDIYSLSSGYISYIDSRSIGMAVIELGGARRRSDDIIDHTVGFENLLSVNDWVDNQVPLCRIHARDLRTLEVAKSIILKAYRIDKRKIGKINPVIIGQIG